MTVCWISPRRTGQFPTWRESTHDTGWLAPFRYYFRSTFRRRVYGFDANLDGTFAAGERTGSIEYLIDNSNFTGYQQTILEVTKNAAGQAIKRISYTFGTDEITQTVSTINPANGQVSGVPVTQTFGHDGRGSVQVLFDAAAAIAQVYTYSAYGELIAIHNGAAAVVGTVGQANLESLAATNKLYNGEGFDTRTGLYNFRARNYSASLGRFERLDPFAGNPADPFSFNKYGFVHGNPVMGADPTGMFFSALGALAISGLVRGSQAGAIGVLTGALVGGIDANLAGESITKGALNGAKWGGTIGFGIGFLSPFATFFLPATTLASLANLGAGASITFGAIGSAESFSNGHTEQAFFRLGIGFLGFFSLRAAATQPSRPVNIGGEGEVPGVINLQGLWALSRTFSRSYPTPKGEPAGKSLAGMILEGHEFTLYNAAKGKLPCRDGSVPKVYTNSIPIDRPGGVYPSVSSEEIKRVLASGGEWVRDGVVVYTKGS